MGSDPIVPNNHSTRLPPDPCLNIGREGDVVIKEFQKVVAFLLLEADNVSGELWVDVQSLLTGGWVSANQGVDGPGRLVSHSFDVGTYGGFSPVGKYLRNWVPSDGAASVMSGGGLLITGMDGC